MIKTAKKLITQYKVWQARRDLEAAVAYEEELRRTQQWMLRTKIPQLEKALQSAEVDLYLQEVDFE